MPDTPYDSDPYALPEHRIPGDEPPGLTCWRCQRVSPAANPACVYCQAAFDVDAQTTIDTTDLAFKQLRERIVAALGAQPGPEQLSLQVISFGFKFGVPLEADLVFDVRFMENPFYRPELRDSSGLTRPVREFVLGQPVTERFLEKLDELFATLIPAYLAEGKTRLTVAIGCTGGFHRSVAIGEALAGQLAAMHVGPVMVWHRELERRR